MSSSTSETHLEKINEQNQQLSNSGQSEFTKACVFGASKRTEALNTVTDQFYVKLKRGFLYVDSPYMKDEFAKMFPIYEIKLVGEPIILQNYHILVVVEITAWITPKFCIKNIGGGGATIQIPANLKIQNPDGTKSLKRELTPLDYIDPANDLKSAITKATTKAISEFGIAADIYGKQIISEENRKILSEQMEKILSSITHPIQKANCTNKWNQAVSEKKNLYKVFKEIYNEFPIDLEN